MEKKIKKFDNFVNENKIDIDKKELYKKIVSVYLKTGQGVPMFVFGQHKKELNELIKENKVKIVRNNDYRENTICLTGVYCVEENGGRSLDFIRRYLGIKGNPRIDRKVEEFLDKNPKIREQINKEYEDWLKENNDILEKSFHKEIKYDN